MSLQSGLGRIRGMKHPLATLLLLGIALRLVLMPLLSFNIDLTYWMKVLNLIDGGNDLYSVEGYYYSPIWGYVLGAVDYVAHLLGMTDYGTAVPELYPYTERDYSISPYVTSVGFNFLVKVPLLLTDIAIGYLLYRFVERASGDRGKAAVALALWVLCPLSVLESSMHAMFDNLSAMFMLIAFIAAYDRKYILAGAVYSLAVLTKFFPLFFIFLMVAIVFRNEDLNIRAIGKVASAIAAALAAFVIAELPPIIKGQFWISMNFITERVGFHASTMESVGVPLLMALAVLAFLMGAAAHYLCRIRPDILRKHLIDIPADERERKVRKGMLIAAAAMTLLILLYSVYSVASSAGGLGIVDLFDIVGKRFVLLMSVYTLIIEAYLAYRLVFSEGDGIQPYLLAFMMSAAVIFLWPPAPQYVVVTVPALILYAVMGEERFTAPVLIMCGLMALYDFVLAGPSMLFALAVYTDLLSLSALIPMVDLITSYILGGIPTIAPFMAVFGGASYLSLVYLIYLGARRYMGGDE